LLTERSVAAVPVGGLLLTGGASRPMGTDKASIVIADGRTCAQTVTMGHVGAVLVLACDLPAITVDLLESLAGFPSQDTVVPVVNGRAQPLCARFSFTSLDTCQHLVAQGRRSLTALPEATTITWIEHETWSTVADEHCFADIDTPEELARLGGFDQNNLERERK